MKKKEKALSVIIQEERNKNSAIVMDLFYTLKSIKERPTLSDLVKLAKRIKRKKEIPQKKPKRSRLDLIKILTKQFNSKAMAVVILDILEDNEALKPCYNYTWEELHDQAVVEWKALKSKLRNQEKSQRPARSSLLCSKPCRT
jgi:hypothetical protein